MMRFMQWLHRWVSLILVIQVLLWLISAVVFTLMGHHGMSGHQYKAHTHPEMLSELAPKWPIEAVHQAYPDATQVRLTSVLEVPQYRIENNGQTIYLNAQTGNIWETSITAAERIALASYEGPGQVEMVTAVDGSDELVDWQQPGFRIAMDDDLNTRIYVDAASGEVVDHRNTPWVIADWAFRLHFMDYTGGRSFNHLVIWTAGLLSLWFALSGLILLFRNIAQGDFNPRRRPTWLEQLQNEAQPVASSCGGGGTCGLCKVTYTSAVKPKPTAAEQAMLSDADLAAGMRLACQHRVNHHDQIELADADATTHRLTLVNKRQLSPSIVELRFASTAPFHYRAGQFLQFKVPHSDAVITRHYSMATAADTEHLVFTVRKMPAPSPELPAGIGSSYLTELEPGQSVEAVGPFGDFLRTDNNQRTQLFIGGGAGIAPLRALLQDELQQAQPRKCVFFYGARHENELCYRDEFSDHAHVDYTPVLSDEDWDGATGYVHETVAAWLANQDVEQLDVYVCGPPPMLKATLDMLAAANISRARIRLDDFGI